MVYFLALTAELSDMHSLFHFVAREQHFPGGSHPYILRR